MEKLPRKQKHIETTKIPYKYLITSKELLLVILKTEELKTRL